jgi:phage gpG-like protein
MATLADFSSWLEKLPTWIDIQQSELQAAADGQVARIKERTSQGVAVDLGLFPLYASSTKKLDPPNLSDTGAMLGSITTYADENEAHVFFGDVEQERIAEFHNYGTSKMPQRYFFGVSLQDRDEIMGDFRQSIFRRVNQ